MEKITPDHVRELVDSTAIDAIMVRYEDGRVEVRSGIRTDEAEPEPYRIIVRQDELSLIDDSGMDFNNLSPTDLEALAESLMFGEGDE
ncbi:hypothetical protein AB0G15_05740 [Streptosporangium sp. NPDC023825]|uniref:hypothetical protein n=1 Tax=Streptosporangium sp. NPDC023825 TaxID=3154909 RepID=UPI003426E599